MTTVYKVTDYFLSRTEVVIYNSGSSMFATSADNPRCLILLALECELVKYQIGMAGVNDARCHQP